MNSIIFSVCKGGKQDKLNTHRIVVRLERYAIDYKSIQGVYNGVKEESFLVPYTKHTFKIVSSIAKEYEQDSILLVRNDLGKLIFFDGRLPLTLGRWSLVANRRGLNAYSVIDGQVWICK